MKSWPICINKYIELLWAYNYTFPKNLTEEIDDKIKKPYREALKSYTDFVQKYFEEVPGENKKLSYSNYKEIMEEWKRLEKNADRIIDALGAKFMAMVSEQMYSMVDERRKLTPGLNPVAFHSELCTEEETKEFEQGYEEETKEGK